MSVGRSSTVTRVILIISVVVLAGVVVWLVWGRLSFRSQPDIQVIGKYIDGYQNGNLAAVKSTITPDLVESLPTSQTVFANDMKKSKFKVESWRVTKVDRNPDVGQALVDIALTTNTGTYNIEFDVLTLPEGPRIRSIENLANPNRPGAGGSSGTGQSSGHGGSGMPVVPGHY